MKSLGAPVLGDALYADANAARREERAYLHAAALRLPTSPALVSAEEAAGCLAFSVACRPSVGAAFAAPGFVSLFRSWFPDDATPAADQEWFGGTPVATAPPRSSGSSGSQSGSVAF